MDRVSTVSQPFRNFPETRFRPRGTLAMPVVRHEIYSIWKICFSAIDPKSPRIFARFLQHPAVTRARAAECASFSMWTFGRAGGRAKPGVRQFLEQIGRFGKAAPAYARSHHLENPHPPLERNRQNIARPDSLGRGFNPPGINAHMTSCDKPCGKAPGFRHPRKPQPFVEPLAERHALTYRRSVSPLNIHH